MGLPFLSIRAVVAALILGLTLLSAPRVQAQQPQSATINAADGAAIRQVIQDQLAAFQRDDAVAAFSDATPMIRDMFFSPDNFMDMVKSKYRPVYRPRHIEFGDIDTVDGKLTQHMQIVGPDGKEVEALYFMERLNGRWLINGCELKPSYQA